MCKVIVSHRCWSRTHVRWLGFWRLIKWSDPTNHFGSDGECMWGHFKMGGPTTWKLSCDFGCAQHALLLASKPQNHFPLLFKRSRLKIFHRRREMIGARALPEFRFPKRWITWVPPLYVENTCGYCSFGARLRIELESGPRCFDRWRLDLSSSILLAQKDRTFQPFL